MYIQHGEATLYGHSVLWFILIDDCLQMAHDCGDVACSNTLNVSLEIG